MADSIPGNTVAGDNDSLTRFPSTGLVNFNDGNRVVDFINRRNNHGGAGGGVPQGGAQPNVRFRFTTAVSGQIGVWKAKTINDPNPLVSYDLTFADLGTVSSDEDLIVWVLEEVASGARMAAVNEIGVGIVIHAEDSATGFPIAVHVAPAIPRSVFPVRVEVDGGADGDGTTAASWTYTVTSLPGDELGTGVPVTRPRPNGSMVTYASPGGGYGTAFYDGGTLVLWDAGEVEDTTEDCAEEGG